ncbi:FtsK/SpoIIIE family DNA translocase [Blautia segnis]|nr:DNA translocase FtsK [Blautia segnis]
MAASKTQKSNTRKKSTAKGNVSGKKKTAGRPSTRKNVNTKQSISSGFQTEIVILVLIAASIILMVSCLGFGGSVGGSISRALMGVMGLMAYAFPFVLFGVSVFLISNKGNVLAYKKTAAAAVLFLVLCGVFQLLTEGYAESTTLAEYYKVSSQYHTGGGAIGGAICISTISAFGTVGAYVIIVLVILVCLILITQHSFLGFLYKLYDKLLEMLKGTHERYQEGAPERELRRQVKAQQRQMAAQERRERRMKELEAALAEEDLDLEEEELESEDGSKKTSSIFGKKKQKNRDSLTEASQPVRRQARRGAEAETTGFLVGTDLFSDMEAYGDGMDDQVSLPEDTGLDFAIHRSETVDTEEVLPETVMEEQQQLAHFGEEMQPQAVNPVQDAEDEDSYAGVDFKEAMATARTMQATSAGGSGTGADVSGSHGSGRAASTSGSSGTADGSHGVAPAGEERASRQPAKNPKSSRQEIESGIVNIQHEISTQEAAVKREYQYPSVNLLKRGNGKSQGDSDAHLRKTAQKLQEILYNFGVNAKVTNVSCGPTVTRYELQPEMGVKVSKIVGLADDIKLNLAAPDIRIEAPIPGKAAVGIEVPNKEHSAVMLRDLIQSPEFQNAKSKLAFAAGKDIEGKTVVADIAKMPHLLIAGSTGSGKSVCINTLIISILYKAKPDEVKLIMIDPKVVELSVYNGIPHLFIPVVTDPKKAAGALNWAVNEMSNRYNTFAEYGVRNLEEFNRKLDKMTFPEGEQRPEKMCQIVIIVDELADLMMVAPGDVEDAICRLAQLARAAGIHLVIATQRPSVNVITGLIKANMPSRIAFAVTSGVDSRTILDMNGAEKLLGKGDMLFYPQGYQKPARLQGAFVSDDEVSDIVNFLADKNPRTDYDSKIEQQMNNAVLTAGGSSGGEERDVYFEQAGKFIIEKEKASIGMLQRMYKIGFNRAARIMDQLCDAGVVGPEEGTKPRKVLMSMEEFQTYVEEHL